jgi:hypothetical protein
MKLIALAFATAMMLVGPALADSTICTVRHDGYAYEGPNSASEPKQLFPIKKGEQTIVAKWGERWHKVQFENHDDNVGWVRTDNLKCKTE